MSPSRIAVLVLLATVTGCGDGGHVRISKQEGAPPAPGIFRGATSTGGEITIQVGSIEQILFECGNTPVLKVFSPPEPVHDDGTFDVAFEGVGRTFHVTGTFTDDDTGHGRITDANRQCDATFDVTRQPLMTAASTRSARRRPPGD